MIFFLWGPGPLGCAVAVTWGLPLLAPCGTPEGRGSCVQARAAQPGVGRRFMARIPKERGCVCPSPSGSTGDLQVPLAVRWGRNLLDPWVTPSWSWRRQFSFSVCKTFAFSAALHLLPTLPRQQDAQLCPHSPVPVPSQVASWSPQPRHGHHGDTQPCSILSPWVHRALPGKEGMSASMLGIQVSDNPDKIPLLSNRVGSAQPRSHSTTLTSPCSGRRPQLSPLFIPVPPKVFPVPSG